MQPGSQSGGSVTWNFDVVGDARVNAALKTTQGNAKQTANAIGDVDNASKNASSSTGKLATSVAAGAAIFEVARRAISGTSQFLKDSVESANKYQAALLGLNSVAGAFGANQIEARNAAQSLAKDGLLTVSESALALKNLLASGFGLQESVTLVNRFKDSAAFGRQSALSFGQAVTSATEGIKNGNSILVDNAGVTKNLSVILKEAGKSQQDVMNIQSDASVRQALYNGLLRETAPQLGNAAQLTDTFAGAQAKAAAQTEILKQNVGGVVQAVGVGLLQVFTAVIGNNQQLVTSLIGASIGAGVFAAALAGLVLAVNAFQLASFLAFITNPAVIAIAALAALVGVVLFKAFNKVQESVKAQNQAMLDNSKAGQKMASSNNGVSKSQQNLAEKIADVNEQIAKQNRSFLEQLAEIVKTHQDKVNDIKKQLDEENASYAKSAAEKKKSFLDEQKSLTQSHNARLVSIQQQLDRELATNRNSNSLRVRDLQRSLLAEQTSYAQNLQDKEIKYQEDVTAAQEANVKKTTDLQLQLATENAFLNKHAADVAAVRNVILLDEIDKLKRSNAEQLAALDKQKQQAIKSAADTAGGINNAFAGQQNQIADTGATLGAAMGKGLKDAVVAALKDVGNSILKPFKDLNAAIENPAKKGFKAITDALTKFEKSLGGEQFNGSIEDYKKSIGRYKGGPVTANSPYIVGERGPELMVPNVSGTIIPANETQRMLNNSGGGKLEVTQNIFNQTDLTQGLRDLAWRLNN